MRRFHVQFSEKNLTGNAGLVHLGRFAEKLGLIKMLQQHISIQRGDTAIYRPADVVMMLVMGVLAGAKHISHLAILRSDTAIRHLFKWN
ncbi:MAG: transposase, partial [Desulfococcus sp.]